MPRLPASLEVLRQRNYRLLLSGQMVSFLGDGMVSVALAFAVLEIGGSASAVGLVLASRAVPLVAGLLVGGVIADRTSRRAVMVAADLVRLASQGTIAALLIAGVADVWMLAALSAVTGASTGFFVPAGTGLLPAIVAPTDLQSANGLRGVGMASGAIVGPIVAGVLVASAGAGWALAADAATFAVSAAFLVRLRVPARDAAVAASFLDDMRAGWVTFRSRHWLWTFVLWATFANVLLASWTVLGPVIADRDLGGAQAWGAVLGAMGAGGLVGGLAAIRLRPARPLLLAACAYSVDVVAIGLLAAGAPTWLLGVGAFALGAGGMLGNTVFESVLQRHIPDKALSRVSAYDWFGSLALQPVGLALWGPVAAVGGIGTALWIVVALQIAGMFAVLAIPDIRHLPADPEELDAVPAPAA